MSQTIEIVEDKKKEEKSYGFSIESLVQTNEKDGIVTVEDVTAGKKRSPGRPRKDGTSIVYTDTEGGRKSSKESMEKTFEKGYTDNAKLLYSAIFQTEEMYKTIDSELANFRSSKSYGGKNRLAHMAEFMNTQVGLVNTKITAVRELDSIRNKINDLVLKKEQMLKDTNEDNSDKAVMDAYYALVNAPRYGLPAMRQNLAPSTINTGINLGGGALQSTTIVNNDLSARSNNTGNDNVAPVQVSVSDVDESFDSYQRNLTPVQKKMIADKDPNIKTVVVYDQSTGSKWFDVVNVATGASIPGIQRPAEFLLDAMRIDSRNGIAVNSNTNMTFPLVLTGTRAVDEL